MEWQEVTWVNAVNEVNHRVEASSEKNQNSAIPPIHSIVHKSLTT